MPAPRNLICTWPISSFHGWGVYGLHIALHLAADADLFPIFPFGTTSSHRVITKQREEQISGVVRASEQLAQELIALESSEVSLNHACLKALGTGFRDGREGVVVWGRPTLGVVFLEDTNLNKDALAQAENFPLIITGSRWNRALLESYQLGPIETVFQGVDREVFWPGPKQGWLGEGFQIFSGGKLEYRKGQDLVLMAFKKFRQRHSDARLITAWHSQWPELARSLEHNPNIAALRFHRDREIDVVAWAEANGIPGDSVVDLGRVPNQRMGKILREVDVAVFPNRAEGGTNLVAMECMACGVPVILSENTGHLDLIGSHRTISLTEQSRVSLPGTGTEGWGESSVDEIVESLDNAYRDRQEAQDIGRRAALFMRTWSWPYQVEALKQAILPHFVE